MQRFQKVVTPLATPQSEAIPGREQEMQANHAGGYAFTLDKWDLLDRFLVLGTEGGTYYVSEDKQTQEACAGVRACIAEDGARVVNRVVEISEAGRAPKNDPALFVLALCASNQEAGAEGIRRLAFMALPKVARIGTHLFHFAEYVQGLRGWGRGLRHAVGKWYTDREADQLERLLVKYQARDGWSNRDLLRLAHPKPTSNEQKEMFRWVTGKVQGRQTPLIAAMEEAQKIDCKYEHDRATLIDLIVKYRLEREMLPTEALQHREIWEALIPNLGYTALIRNLATITRVGALKPMGDLVDAIAARILDTNAIQRSRVHPIQILSARETYASGHGLRGAHEWVPVPQITMALDQAFYAAFRTIRPAGKRMFLALDVSPSMAGGMIAGVPGITPRVGSACMALVTARTEERYFLAAFAHTMSTINMDARSTLAEAVRAVDNLAWSATDCAAPMHYALKHGIETDCFVIYTDNETWSGRLHAPQALEAYRKQMGIPAKMVVVGMTANEVSVADPKDPAQLNVVGFDTATPNLISDFVRGSRG